MGGLDRDFWKCHDHRKEENSFCSSSSFRWRAQNTLRAGPTPIGASRLFGSTNSLLLTFFQLYRDLSPPPPVIHPPTNGDDDDDDDDDDEKSTLHIGTSSIVIRQSDYRGRAQVPTIVTTFRWSLFEPQLGLLIICAGDLAIKERTNNPNKKFWRRKKKKIK